MKKEKITLTTLNTSLAPDKFKDVPTVQNVLNTVIIANERNERKRETLKGTILQAVMIDKDLLKIVKRYAFENEISISDAINKALRAMYQ